MRKTALQILLLLALAWSQASHAADPSAPIMLVAKPELHDRLFGAAVLVVTPLSDGGHAGFIVNHPTQITLAALYPDHAPARKVLDPVYLGGPVTPDILFALVRAENSPGGRSVELMPGLYAAFEEPVVDGIIEARPDSARFVAGFVLWEPGELEREIELGAWYVIEPDPRILTRSPSGLWEDLLRGLQHGEELLTVRNSRQ
jgi:putative transcriptional regulator